MSLTETAIRKLATPDADTFMGDGNNLYLRLSPTGRKTWMYRTKMAGKTQKQKLGVWPAMSLAMARAKAADLNTRTLPENAKAESVAQEWYERTIEPNYKATKNAEVYLRRFIRFFGSRNIGTLSTAELVNNLSAYGKKYPVAANRCRSSWSLIFQYAKERGLIEHNPLAGTSNKVAGGREKPRNRVLTDDEIKVVMVDTHEHAPLLRALLLSGCRISELQAAKLEHIDGDILHIPENKSSRPHWVAITPLLRQQFTDNNGYLFAVRSPTAVQSRLKNRLKLTWTPHDLRRTFVTRCAGLGIGLHVVEKMVNHVMEGMLAVYNHSDYKPERIEAAHKLANEIARIAEQSPQGNDEEVIDWGLIK